MTSTMLRAVTLEADETSSAVAVQSLPEPHPGYFALKRTLDVVAAAALLVLLAPVLALIALAIKLESAGPILFGHQRVGAGGRMFVCYKFRSMAHGPTSLPPELARAFAQSYKLERDPRVTRVGRILRKLSLDELPQLLNILLGTMSLVGPRPMVEVEVREKYGAAAHHLLSARPGLTGLWQVSGRSNLPYEARVQLDLEYVGQRSIGFDLWLLLRTIPAVIFMRGSM